MQPAERRAVAESSEASLELWLAFPSMMEAGDPRESCVWIIMMAGPENSHTDLDPSAVRTAVFVGNF